MLELMDYWDCKKDYWGACWPGLYQNYKFIAGINLKILRPMGVGLLVVDRVSYLTLLACAAFFAMEKARTAIFVVLGEVSRKKAGRLLALKPK